MSIKKTFKQQLKTTKNKKDINKQNTKTIKNSLTKHIKNP